MTYIISLGGSLIAPRGVDVGYLKSLSSLILKQATKNKRFIIIPGGGYTCRYYQAMAAKIAKPTTEALDWIGIATNRLHSYLLHAIFGDKAKPGILRLGQSLKKLKRLIVIAEGGQQPGGSSDTVALSYAQKFRAKILVNLTNVDGIYDKDPKKFKNAKLIERFTWQEFRTLFGTARKPGQHLPFDPAGSKLAEKLGVKVIIMNGKNFKNLKNFLADKNFRGSLISKK